MITNYQYYLVDCVNGSDQNDGIKKPFRTLDQVFSVNRHSDLRIRFLSAGEYPTTAQHFSGLSMHWDGTGAGGDVIVNFCGQYKNKRIQFYNCYTHLLGVQIKWDPVNSLYFECGYTTISEGSAFLSGEVRFNGMYMYADGASFWRLIVRESYAKLHSVTITKPGDNTDAAIHSRDSLLTLYGSITLRNRMTSTGDDAAIVLADRGRVYISTAPKEPTGYRYGVKGNNAELYIAQTYLNRFTANTADGNAIVSPPAYSFMQLEEEVKDLRDEVEKLKKAVRRKSADVRA